MNYIKFEIGGKERGFKLGCGFLGDVLKHFDTDIVGLGGAMVKNPFSVTPVMLYHAHRHNCIRKGEAIDFKLHDVEDWMDDIPDGINNKDVERFLVMFFEGMKKHLPQTEEEDNSKKK